jgi:2-succinyl-6-hydroxy-2,4-cyclohexadiene-1-carboxylate synthase
VRCALIHGFTGDPANWDEVIDNWQLPEEPQPIVLPGHSAGGPVLEGWDANLAAIGDAIAGCECVVGYSLGARVALGLIATGRAAFGVLIGVNPGINELERADRRRFDATWARMLRTDGLDKFIAAWEAQPLFATQKRVSIERRLERRARRYRLDAELLAQSLEQMGLGAMPDYWSAVPAHRDRIALITGDEDTKYQVIANRLPAKLRETVAESGHDPTLEQPELLAAAIARSVVNLTE